MKLSDAIGKYITNHTLLYHTEKTIANYRDVLSVFLRFVGDVDLDSISFETVQEYNKHLIDKKISKASVATYLRHIKAFFNFLENEGLIEKDSIARRIKLPKTPKKNINLFSRDDMLLVFESIKEESDWLAARDCVVVALMYDSGLRQAEVCKIKLKDIDFDSHILLVHGKGDKDRFVPFGEITLEYLNRYRILCPYDNEYLLCGRRGERMTENAVKKMMEKLRHRTGLEGLSSHKLRHNFATNWCIDSLKKNGTVDSLQLMTIMGHSDLKTTGKYIHEAYEMYSALRFDSHLDSILA